MDQRLYNNSLYDRYKYGVNSVSVVPWHVQYRYVCDLYAVYFVYFLVLQLKIKIKFIIKLLKNVYFVVLIPVNI